MVLLVGSCGDDEPTAPCPTYEVGAFEGRVLAGGVGIQATVGARAAERSHRGEILFLTRSDSTGHYRLAVPSGSYWLEVNPSHSGVGAGMFPGLGDTLTITNHVRQADLRCASVRFRVHTPPGMEGREMAANLELPWRTDEANAVVHDGQLEYLFPLLQAASGRFSVGTWPVRYWLPGTYDRDSARIVAFPVDQPLVVAAALDRWAALSGTFRGPSQDHASVEAYAAVDSARVGATSTTADGSFVLDVLSARPVKIRVEMDDAEQWIGGESFATAQVFDLQPGEAVRDLTVGAGGVRCTLEGPGNLINQRAVVVLRDESGRNHGALFSSDSPVSVRNLRPGRYYLYVSGIPAEQTWGSQWYDGATSLAHATPIDVLAGEITPVTVHLFPGGSLDGRLLLADGTPVSYGPVTIIDADGASSSIYWIQHRDVGAFRFRGLGDGGYRLAAQTEEGNWWFPGTANPDSARVVEVIDHAAVTGIEWRLP